MRIWWWLVACSSGPSIAVAPRPDVLLVTLDTTRADRIGAYGYSGAATPTLDGLAATGRRYERAYSPVPLTIPSHASLFTAHSPSHHQIHSNGDATLPPSATTLTERLSEHGYRTGASVGAFVTGRVWGFDQGFDRFYEGVADGRDGWQAQRPGAEVVDDLLRWEAETRAQHEPRFAWAHLYDPHHPYTPWPEHLEAVEGRPYDAELAYVDAQVARLVARFDREGTVVVVVGDHGEGLGQHGELAHGWYVYDATQRVPLIMTGPGIAAGEVVADLVSLIDVAPLVLAHLELPDLPASDGSAVPGNPVFLESWQLAQRFGLAPHLAVVDGPLKLIDVPRPELYDVVADPREQHDLAAQRPDEVLRLQALLRSADLAEPSRDPAHPPDPRLSAQLAELGYVDAGLAGPSTQARPDPKAHRELLITLQGIDQRVTGPEVDAEVAAQLQALVIRYPHITELRTRLAGLWARMGRTADAARVVHDALANDPDNVPLRIGLAALLAGEGRLSEAADLYQEAAEAMPWQPRLRAMCLLALIDSGRVDEAVELGGGWLDETLEDASVAGLTGVALVKARRFDAAIPLLDRGLQANPPERGVAYHVSAARLGAGDRGEATRLLDLELDHHPTHLEALHARLQLFAATRDWGAQLVRVEAARALRPEEPALMHIEAQTLYNLQRFAEARSLVDDGLTLAPTFPELMLLDANLMRQEGRTEAALARFEAAKAAKAVQQDP